MGRLKAAARKKLPSSAFALPGQRKYPLEDRAHAANAKARASGKPEQATVDAAVARRYPDMGKPKAKKQRGVSLMARLSAGKVRF